MGLMFLFQSCKNTVFLRDKGREFQTVGQKTDKELIPKGLKREARNCQQRCVKTAVRPKGPVWMKKVRNIWWHTGLIDTLKSEKKQFCTES